jgi:hypothetical protein
MALSPCLHGTFTLSARHFHPVCTVFFKPKVPYLQAMVEGTFARKRKDLEPLDKERL